MILMSSINIVSNSSFYMAGILSNSITYFRYKLFLSPLHYQVTSGDLPTTGPDSNNVELPNSHSLPCSFVTLSNSDYLFQDKFAQLKQDKISVTKRRYHFLERVQDIQLIFEVPT